MVLRTRLWSCTLAPCLVYVLSQRACALPQSRFQQNFTRLTSFHNTFCYLENVSPRTCSWTSLSLTSTFSLVNCALCLLIEGSCACSFVHSSHSAQFKRVGRFSAQNYICSNYDDKDIASAAWRTTRYIFDRQVPTEQARKLRAKRQRQFTTSSAIMTGLSEGPRQNCAYGLAVASMSSTEAICHGVAIFQRQRPVIKNFDWVWKSLIIQDGSPSINSIYLNGLVFAW